MHVNVVQDLEIQKCLSDRFGLFALCCCISFVHCNEDLFLPSATKLRQGNIFRSVCQEFCPRRGSVCLSACWDTTPWADPPDRHPWGDTPSRRLLLRTVRILLECILVVLTFSVK